MNSEFFRMLAVSCGTHSPSFLSFPTWYEYLPSTTDPATGACAPQLLNINDIWLIVAAAIEILLRVAAIMAVIFVIYGGVQYIISQGSPERTDQARKTVIAAVIGLVITVMASLIVGFLAGSILKG